MRYFHPPHPEQLQHARALFAKGWRPNEAIQPDDILGTVRLIDTLQHVDVATWQVLHLMADLPVLGEVLAGNPEIRMAPGPVELPSKPPMVDNGILALVGGALVGQGSMQLPVPGLAEAGEPRRVVVLEVPGQGPVRVTYELRQHKHGRSRHWSWGAVRADKVDAQ